MGVRLVDIHLSQTLRKAGALCTGFRLAVNVIGFVYSGLQTYDLTYFFTSGKHVIQHHLRYYFDFLLDQVLVVDINIGYEDIVNTQVLAFNGKTENLKRLVSMVENCDNKYLKFDLEYNQMVVLQTKTAKAATLDEA